MNKQEQIDSDKKVLASLEAEYKRAQRVIYSIRALVTDLNFEELIPDSQERCLMVDELQAYDYIRTNLMNRIRFYRARVKTNKPEPWEEDNATRTVNTLCGPVRVINTDKVTKEELDKMMFQTMFQTHHDPNFDDVDPKQKAQAMAMHHCGQDCDCDDACCQAGSPCGRSAAAAEKQAGYSLKSLEGMQVIKVCGSKCKDCPCGDGLREYPSGRDASSCVKVELVGGYTLCLAPLPNSIVTE